VGEGDDYPPCPRCGAAVKRVDVVFKDGSRLPALKCTNAKCGYVKR
jgi:uncharacterized Zn finger protein